MKSKCVVLGALTFVSCSVSSADAKDEFRFTQSSGPHAVGLHIVEQTDSSRVFAASIDAVTGEAITGDRSRPLLTLIWYPAASSGQPLNYGDYLDLAGREDRFGRNTQSANQVAEQRLKELLPPDISPDDLASIKRQPMLASRDAQELTEKFPLVVYAPSFSASAFENADLCEYLASNGYVVVATASMSAHSRWMTQNLEGAEAQARDIRFLVGWGQHLSNVDPTKIVVAGYSWGGVANFFAAALDDRITALIALDGGIRNVGKIVAEAKYVTPEQLAIPILYLSSRPLSAAKIAELKLDVSDDVLSRLKYADVYTVTFKSLVHYEFASEHLRFLWRTDPEMFPGDFTFEQTLQSYGRIARYTLDFLDGVTKGNHKSLDRVTRRPSSEDILVGSVNLAPAKARPVNRKSFAAALHSKGFEHATAIYTDMRKLAPDFEVKPPELNEWIDELLAAHQLKEAEGIAQLFKSTYPDRPGPYYWLAMIAKERGKTNVERENLQTLLKIKPNDEEAKKELARIGLD